MEKTITPDPGHPMEAPGSSQLPAEVDPATVEVARSEFRRLWKQIFSMQVLVAAMAPVSWLFGFLFRDPPRVELDEWVAWLQSLRLESPQGIVAQLAMTFTGAALAMFIATAVARPKARSLADQVRIQVLDAVTILLAIAAGVGCYLLVPLAGWDGVPRTLESIVAVGGALVCAALAGLTVTDPLVYITGLLDASRRREAASRRLVELAEPKPREPLVRRIGGWLRILRDRMRRFLSRGSREIRRRTLRGRVKTWSRVNGVRLRLLFAMPLSRALGGSCAGFALLWLCGSRPARAGILALIVVPILLVWQAEFSRACGQVSSGVAIYGASGWFGMFRPLPYMYAYTMVALLLLVSSTGDVTGAFVATFASLAPGLLLGVASGRTRSRRAYETRWVLARRKSEVRLQRLRWQALFTASHGPVVAYVHSEGGQSGLGRHHQAS